MVQVVVVVVAVVYKLLHYCYLAEPKNSATWRRLAASAKGWVRVRFSDVITRGALADQPRTAAPGEIYTFLNVGEIFGEILLQICQAGLPSNMGTFSTFL